MKTLTMEQAIRILEILGCSDDPIWRRGTALTVEDLEYAQYYDWRRPSTALRIRFCVRNKWVLGTMQDMVKERLGIKTKVKPCKTTNGSN